MPFFIPIMAAAMIASSAIMVAPYANEELKKQQIAKDIDHLTATEIADRQSTRLNEPHTGYTSIVVNDNQPKLPALTQQSWFIPLSIIGIAFVAIMVLRR